MKTVSGSESFLRSRFRMSQKWSLMKKRQSYEGKVVWWNPISWGRWSNDALFGIQRRSNPGKSFFESEFNSCFGGKGLLLFLELKRHYDYLMFLERSRWFSFSFPHWSEWSKGSNRPEWNPTPLESEGGANFQPTWVHWQSSTRFSSSKEPCARDTCHSSSQSIFNNGLHLSVLPRSHEMVGSDWGTKRLPCARVQKHIMKMKDISMDFYVGDGERMGDELGDTWILGDE